MVLITDYHQYISSIKDGIIKTSNIKKDSDHLWYELNFLLHEIRMINKFTYDIKLLNPEYFLEEFSKQLQSEEYFISINNEFGFYPTYIYVTTKNTYLYYNVYKFTMETFHRELINPELYDMFIRFDAEYEDGFYRNNFPVPKSGYYLTSNQHREKIWDHICRPRRNPSAPYHGDRIYLFPNLEDIPEILDQLKITNSEEFFDLYEIELSEEDILHYEPNYPGFYTYYNYISANRIQLLEKDL